MKDKLLSVMKNTKQKIGIGAACCLMILSGTILSGTVFAQSDDTASAVSNKTTAQTSVKTDTITTEEANTIALKKTNGGEVKESKLDRDDQVLKYEIKIMNGDTEYEVDINASTGKILKYESEKIAEQQTVNTQSQTTIDTTQSNNQSTQNAQSNTTSNNSSQQTIAKNTGGQATENTTTTQQTNANQITATAQVITTDKAQSIALSASGGGTVVKCEYDVEEQEYEIEILNGTMEHDIDINAYSGAIISHDKEVEDFD